MNLNNTQVYTKRSRWI